MAAKQYGLNLLISPWHGKYVCSIGYLGTSNYFQMTTLGVSWTFYGNVEFALLTAEDDGMKAIICS